MSTSRPTILTPFDIPGMALRNRLAVAPMTRVTATADGLPTPTMGDYYAGFAAGGFGLVITEGLYSDQAHSQGYLNQPGLASEAQAEAWAPLTAAMRNHGAVTFAQIMHAGALSQGNPFRDGTVGAAAVQPKGEQMSFYYGQGAYRLPVQMTDAQIENAIQGFVDAAERAVGSAGFDGVEIHGANGYLLDQFLTRHTNTRLDRWGGSIYNRVALLVEVLNAVKAKVAGRAPVGMRISQGKVNDFLHKWEGGEQDAEVIFGSLADAGVDFLHVTEFEAWQPAFVGETESLAALARRYAPGVPLIANGGLHDLARAGQLLDQGADIVALGRGALANPDLPRRIQNGEPLRQFDASILGPIADIKGSELALRS
ncbi:NADH:flavin oxidoreductase [uncultured Stenotrophomonas sp.]|uniref:NADH:flavin oxidoreductase n=1 Tax=uncultured Stenotrophomonas sp. TaxID=165438 RepID=UPI0028EE60E4|nr:NADH:flavin oxidoreductase [uncultured Stenotrophomonas sp.]